MQIEPLSKTIYDEAILVGVSRITLHFSGGSDEGNLYVDLYPSENSPPEFEEKVENWAWNVYGYNGAGDGNDFGDDIEYDLKNKTATASDWAMSRTEGASVSEDMVVDE